MADTEKKLNGFRRYSKVILDIVRERAELSLEEDREGLLECYDNLLFDKDGPTRLEKVLSEDEKFFSMVSSGFSEINSSYESLLDFEIYVRRFPYGGTRITELRYLSHIIEAYLNEMYIFQERLVRFLNELEKVYKSNRRRLVIKKIVDVLREYLLECLKPIVATRGSHVHQKRYIDRGIERLSSLELLATSDADFADLYKSVYKVTRKEWRLIISENNKVVKKLLDKYFDDLFDVIFSEKRELIYPSNM